MNTIDPKMLVSEILQQHPETLNVFRAFGMKCAESSLHAAKTLEENFVAEQVDFMALLGSLNKAIHPQGAAAAQAPSSQRARVVGANGVGVEVEVPPEIGAAISQRTSIGSRIPLNAFMDAWGCLGLIAAIFMFITLIYTEPVAALGLALALASLAAVLLIVRKDRIGIVGAQGVALYKISKRTGAIRSRKLYLFRDVTDLVFSQTTHYMNGVYTHSSYTFALQSGTLDVYSQAGRYFNPKDKPGKYGWRYEFLCDVENAWTSFLLADLAQKLQAEGFVRFNVEPIADSMQIEVGHSYLKFNGTLIPKEAIGKVYVGNGVLYVEDASYKSQYMGLKTSGNRFTIPVNKMPNKKVFLALLNRLL
jgi:hypothetical protein